VHRTSDAAAALPAPRSNAARWWRGATVYRVFLPSFADGNGDGIGDLGGLRERLGYLVVLGVDAVSLTGLLTAPDPRSGANAPGIDRDAGGLPELDAFIGEAHDQGLKVILEGPHGAAQGLERTVRFWLDRGIDGFRTDSADRDSSAALRRLLDTYPARVLVGGSDGPGPQQRLQYGLSRCGWDSAAMTATITSALSATGSSDGTPTWVLTDRGGRRPVGRYGDPALAGRRARAVALLQLTLPGAVEICAGDELGLPDAPQADPRPPWADRRGGLPDREPAGPTDAVDLDDNSWLPLPWAGEKPPYGFTRHDTSWLPIPEGWVDLTVESQLEDADSTLSLYRRALEIRHGHGSACGDGVEWYGAPEGCLALRRTGGLVCALNTTASPVPLPPGEVLLSSVPLAGGELPADSAAWLV
jgi:alpha-glucosidase